MHDLDLFHHEIWYPLAPFGLTSSSFGVNIDTIFFTWCSMAVFIALAIAGKIVLHKKSLAGHVSRQYIAAFIDMVHQSLPSFAYRHFSFISTIFSFIFICNTILFFPFFEEPTKDLNTTLALGITSFVFVQSQILYAHGLKNYLGEYFKMPLAFIPNRPFTIFTPIEIVGRAIINILAGLFSLPLELLGKIGSIVSLSFRLFGNIFGGSVITAITKYAFSGSIVWQIIGIATGLNIILLLFFGFFEGLIQAFVFTVISLSYLSMGIMSAHTE